MDMCPLSSTVKEVRILASSALTPLMQAGTDIHQVLERYLSVYYWVCRFHYGAGSCLRVGRSTARTICFKWLSDGSQNTYIKTLLTRRASLKSGFQVAAAEYPGSALADDLWVGRLRAGSWNEGWGSEKPIVRVLSEYMCGHQTPLMMKTSEQRRKVNPYDVVMSIIVATTNDNQKKKKTKPGDHATDTTWEKLNDRRTKIRTLNMWRSGNNRREVTDRFSPILSLSFVANNYSFIK